MKNFTSLVLCFVLAFTTQTATAQFTQFSHRADTSDYVWDIAPCNDGFFCTVSSTGFRKYDAGGWLMWERYYNSFPVYPSGHYLALHNLSRLVHTDDDGIIFFYLFWDIIPSGGHVTFLGIYPAAMKLDANGDLVWSKRYGHSYYPSEYFSRMNLVKVDARRMEGSTAESQKYIFSLPGAPAEATDPPYNQGQTLNILSIDGDGNLLWNKKYRPAIPNDIIWEMPQTISYAGNDPDYGNLYYVSGERFENTQSGNSGWMFQMFIDESGNIVRPYQRVKHSSEYNYSGHAVYDPANDAVMHSFSLCRTYITGGPEDVVTVVQNVDRNYHINWYRLYWAPNSDHNYVYKIEKSKLSDDEFVMVGMWNDWDIYHPHDLNEAINQVLLKINGQGDVMFYKLYMRGELVQPPSHAALAVNEHRDEGSENYIFTSLSSRRRVFGLPNPLFSRLIGTDVNGEVCGHEDAALDQMDANILYRAKRDYVAVDDLFEQDIDMYEYPTGINIDYCEFNEFDGMRRVEIINNRPKLLPESEIVLYPTILAGLGQSLVNINFADQKGEYNVTVYAIDGRKISTQSVTADPQKVYQIDLMNLGAGTYYIQVVKQDASYKKTFKVSRL